MIYVCRLSLQKYFVFNIFVLKQEVDHYDLCFAYNIQYYDKIKNTIKNSKKNTIA